MTVSTDKSEPEQNNIEFNFRKQEEVFKRKLDEERAARAELERKIEEIEKVAVKRRDDDDDENDNEPYVDSKRLKKELEKFSRNFGENVERRAEEKSRKIIDEERRSNWLKQNPDFSDVMQHAQVLADKDPEWAETILSMPEGFERQKLVYKNIKALGLHKKEDPKNSIQDKIDQNRKSPFYQPSGIAAAPYAAVGDFSEAGQKSSYDKMQELKKRLRL